MKKLILASAFLVLASAFIAGSMAKPSNSSEKDRRSDLTASDLAMLMDFHAWKVSIPQSQQPFKKVRIVVIKPDGTIIQKFCTANQGSSTENPGYLSCSSIVLGFRVEQGVFSGHLNHRDDQGGGEGYNLNFADVFANALPGWSGDKLVWNGNRAQLAIATKDGEMKDSVLALELVK